MSPTRRLILSVGLVLIAAVPAIAQDPDALTRAAQSALHRADGLADRNIAVRVLADGTAILSGPARPADAAKAEEVLKGVPGITQVVNTCDPIGEPEPPPSPGKRPRLGPAPAGPALPAVPPPPTVSAPVSRPTPERRADEPAARLLDPVAVPGPVDYGGIERVRRSDPRFARLTFDLRDGRVMIAGSSADPAAAWDLARRVAPLVGDRDVVIGR
jgi:hypothetical protein